MNVSFGTAELPYVSKNLMWNSEGWPAKALVRPAPESSDLLSSGCVEMSLICVGEPSTDSHAPMTPSRPTIGFWPGRMSEHSVSDGCQLARIASMSPSRNAS